jgi:hypothetical protein
VTPEAKIALIGAFIAVLTLLVFVFKVLVRRAPLKVRKPKYQKKWKELQQYCKDKETWPKALSLADDLLDKALIKRGFKGKNMGERIVSAQRKLTDNDAVWFGHKLARRVEEDPELKLKEKDVKEALLGIAQALKDLGAL